MSTPYRDPVTKRFARRPPDPHRDDAPPIPRRRRLDTTVYHQPRFGWPEAVALAAGVTIAAIFVWLWWAHR